MERVMLRLGSISNNAGINLNTRVAEGYRFQFSVLSNNAGINFNTRDAWLESCCWDVLRVMRVLFLIPVWHGER